MLELYHSGLTTCSKQVRHCLREKGLPYKSRYVELWRYENLSPSYLKLNPNGVVPTLVHDGTPVINSFCINEYIEDAFPDPPLRPADPHERARMRYWAWIADEVHLQLARLTHARMLQSSVNDLTPADQQTMLKSTPVPEKRERWAVLTKGGYSDDQLKAALEGVLFVFGRMEEELVKARSMARRQDLFAGRHQHARHRAPHLGAVPRQARPREVSAADGLVGPLDGAAGGEIRLFERHRGDAEAPADQVDRRHRGVSGLGFGELHSGFRSSPRKRGPRTTSAEPATLDSRFRGNERSLPRYMRVSARPAAPNKFRRTPQGRRRGTDSR